MTMSVADRRGSIARGASWALGARVAGALLMLVFQVLVARRVGSDAAGDFYVIFAVVAVTSVMGRMGTDQLILRSVAVASQPAMGPDSLRHAYLRAVTLAAIVLSAVALGLGVGAGLLAGGAFGSPELAASLRVAAPGIVAFGLVAVQGEAIKGLGRPGRGASIQSLVAPVVSLVVFVAWPSARTPLALTIVYVTGLVASAIVGEQQWRRLAPAPVEPPGRVTAADVRSMLATCRPFYASAMSGLLLAWGAVLVLGRLAPGEETASYFAADRWTAVASMVLVAVNGASGPHFARLWAAGRVDELRTMLRQTSAWLAGFGLVLLVVTMTGADLLLRVFGGDFVGAVGPLRVLALGQFVVLAGGPVTTALVMVGGERAQARAGWIAAAVLTALLVGLVPAYGAMGAAVATSVALSTNKIVVVLAVRSALDGRKRGGVVPG